MLALIGTIALAMGGGGSCDDLPPLTHGGAWEPEPPVLMAATIAGVMPCVENPSHRICARGAAGHIITRGNISG